MTLPMFTLASKWNNVRILRNATETKANHCSALPTHFALSTNASPLSLLLFLPPLTTYGHLGVDWPLWPPWPRGWCSRCRRCKRSAIWRLLEAPAQTVRSLRAERFARSVTKHYGKYFKRSKNVKAKAQLNLLWISCWCFCWTVCWSSVEHYYVSAPTRHQTFWWPAFKISDDTVFVKCVTSQTVNTGHKALLESNRGAAEVCEQLALVFCGDITRRYLSLGGCCGTKFNKESERTGQCSPAV